MYRSELMAPHTIVFTFVNSDPEIANGAVRVMYTWPAAAYREWSLHLW